MEDVRNRFFKYVAEVFAKRFKELGLSQYRFLRNSEGLTTRQTLTRILKGEKSINCDTLAVYADLLGLEIIIRPKDLGQYETED